MKRIFLFALAVLMVFSFAGCTVRTEKYTDENGEEKEFTYVTRPTEDKFVSFSAALTEKGYTFTEEDKADGIIDGAKAGKKYTLDDGRVIEIFCYDVKSDAYKEMAKTGKMYMEMFDTYVAVAVNDEYALIPASDAEMKDIFLSLE
ncbi:MAG: hypothetical protein IJD97_04560 [Clostridia bacterium]|nr:hypothetical protein [Clostridia bacterium]